MKSSHFLTIFCFVFLFFHLGHFLCTVLHALCSEQYSTQQWHRFLPFRCQGPVHTIKVEVNPNLVTKCSSSTTYQIPFFSSRNYFQLSAGSLPRLGPLYGAHSKNYSNSPRGFDGFLGRRPSSHCSCISVRKESRIMRFAILCPNDRPI